MDITGASAIVTGGASGLGYATAQKLVELGAHVVIIDLPSSAGEQAAKDLGSATFVAADVTNEEQVQAAVDAASAQGPLRVVVNCAGIATPGKVVGREGPLALETFSRVIGINLIGTFNVLRLAAVAMKQVPALEDGQRGLFVNTASVAAYEGQIGQAAYSASKGGVVAMTIPIARELARDGIRVNVIAPGLFETPMMKGLPEAAQASLATQVPNPVRLGRPTEYASLVAYLVDNVYINGESIRLDGAIRMSAS